MGQTTTCGIDDQRIGQFNAGEALSNQFGKECGSAICPVGAEPEVTRLRNRSDGGQVVNDPGVRRTGRGHRGDDPLGILLGRHGGLQGLPPKAVPTGGNHQGFHVDHVECVLDRRMRLVAHRDAQRAAAEITETVTGLGRADLSCPGSQGGPGRAQAVGCNRTGSVRSCPRRRRTSDSAHFQIYQCVSAVRNGRVRRWPLAARRGGLPRVPGRRPPRPAGPP